MGDSSKSRYWVGFDLGGTKMMAAVFDDDFKMRGSLRRKTKGQEDVEVGIQRIVETIQRVLDENGVSKDAVAGVGIGCPSPVDMDGGVLLDAPNLGWKDLPLRKRLEAAFKWPAVVLNDVDAGVYGEYRFGAARKARCAVGVFPGTGIGGGCVYEGKIIRGEKRSCFEIGHLQVLPDGPLCGCGQRGCLETVASRLAISAQAATAAFRGEAPHLRKEAGVDLANMRSRTLAEAITAGDRAIEKICRDGAKWIGVAIAMTVNLLNPDVVVLGGGMVEAMPEIYREEVEAAADKRVMKPFRKTFKVVLSALGDDAIVTGAAAWARDSVTNVKGADK